MKRQCYLGDDLGLGHHASLGVHRGKHPKLECKIKNDGVYIKEMRDASTRDQLE